MYYTPLYMSTGKQRLLELLDWFQANRKTEATFRLANPTHTEMGMYAFIPSIYIHCINNYTH